MSLFSVKSDPAAAVTRFEGVDAMVVQANSTAEAKALAKALRDGDADALWSGATVTDLTAVPVLTGWVFTIGVNTSTPTSVTVTGDSDDTLDDVLTKVATALVAAGHGTAHAAYNTSTNVLTVASVADALGDKTVTVTVTPPAGLFPTTYTWAQADVVSSKVDGGTSGTALTVNFSTSWVVPAAIQGYRQ